MDLDLIFSSIMARTKEEEEEAEKD